MNSTNEVNVGDPATIFLYTDRYAATVIRVTPKMVVVQEDTATRTDNNGMSDCQDYDYTPNSKGTIHKFRLNNRGVLKNTATGFRLAIGFRDHYYDFDF